MTVRERDELHAQLVRLTEERDARRGECERTKRTLTETKVQLDRAESKYADVTTRLDAVVEDLAAHRARVGSNSGGGKEGAGVHPALAGATADMRVQASELRAALDDLMSIADPGGALKLADTGQARAVRERTRALIARAEDVAVAAMGAVESGAERAFSKAAGTNANGGRRFKLPIY
jgi:chromosome segregation ATPase